MIRSDRLLALVVPILAALLLSPGVAFAYPWMITHQHTGCAQCHVDPSGAGALTQYGRAQAAILLPTHWSTQEEVGKEKDFLFGALPLPDEVIAQADVRGLMIPRPGDVRLLLMQADLRGGVQTELFTAYGSIGVVSEGAQRAWLTQSDEAPHLVSRDYWVGITPTRSLTIRAGRMVLPFGIRDDQHILFTRSVTRTSINADQQLGVAVAGAGKGWRGEIMGIAGNFQIAPDDYRERGYSGFFTYTPMNRVELGVSSLLTVAERDVETLLPRTRQAHGVFSRFSPVSHLAVFAEADLLVDQAGPEADTTLGYVLDLHADYEAAQGVHLKGGGELCQPAMGAGDAALGRGWAAAQWFFLPRVNLRVDALYGPLHCVPGARVGPMALAQLHFFL